MVSGQWSVVSGLFIPSVGLSVLQPVSLSVSYWVSRSVDTSVRQSVFQLVTKPFHQRVIHQSVSEYIAWSPCRSVGHLVVGVSLVCRSQNC